MVKHSRGKVTERGILKPWCQMPSLAPCEKVPICLRLLPRPQRNPALLISTHHSPRRQSPLLLPLQKGLSIPL